MKNIIFLSALLALVGLGCTKKANDNELVIGSYSSNTGATATFGVFQKNGIEMAIEEINAAGGINGKKIKHINYDNKSDNDETLAVVNRLISQDNVLAVLGKRLLENQKSAAKSLNKTKSLCFPRLLPIPKSRKSEIIFSVLALSIHFRVTSWLNS